MNSEAMIRKMLDAVSKGYEPTAEETKVELTEGVNITLDGEDADRFVERLMQLSGQPMMSPTPVQDVPPVTAPVDAPLPMEPTPVDAPALPAPIDEPAMDAHDSHYVCDGCGESMEACHCDEAAQVCMECGLPMSMCECDMSVSSSGPLNAMAENADFDHGHDDVDDEGEVVDPDTYMYKAPTPPQRLVKGVMGDNPMVKEETMSRYKRLVNDYVSFISESDDPNEAGMDSPFTAADRQEFDKDPSGDEEPITDGSRSPMTDVKRQDVMR